MADMENEAILYLVPGGYPLTIVVAQDTIGGAGSAMQFVLPLRGHNLPLTHRHESKLLVALDGELEIRSAGRRIALLRQGQALVLPPGTAHRVHQHGPAPATAGVALWPGGVEQAFRQMAADAAAGLYSRERMICTLADYDVLWDAGGDHSAVTAEVRPLAGWLEALPPPLAQALRQRWR